MSPARRPICLSSKSVGHTSTEFVGDSLKDLPEDVEFVYIPNKEILLWLDTVIVINK